MDTDTFIVHVKFEYVSEEVAGDFEEEFTRKTLKSKDL